MLKRLGKMLVVAVAAVTMLLCVSPANAQFDNGFYGFTLETTHGNAYTMGWADAQAGAAQGMLVTPNKLMMGQIAGASVWADLYTGASYCKFELGTGPGQVLFLNGPMRPGVYTSIHAEGALAAGIASASAFVNQYQAIMSPGFQAIQSQTISTRATVASVSAAGSFDYSKTVIRRCRGPR